MGYKKATHILPHDLLLKVQEYIDGEFLYIPRISDNKKAGEKQPQPVRNYKIETAVFMMTTLRGNQWISLLKNTLWKKSRIFLDFLLMK